MASELASFQEAAVKRIVERLGDPNGSRRFLLADEVGLGKTRVAAGVIQTLQEANKRKAKGFTVVYVCSNSEIAEQNRGKLCQDSNSAAVTRLTLLATESREVERKREKGDLQLFSFTPSTSFHVGGATGIERERKLLLYLLARVWGKRVNKAKWRRFFCCGSKWENKYDETGRCISEGWNTRSRFGDLRRAFLRKIAVDLQQRLKQEWSKCQICMVNPTGQMATGTTLLADVIDDAVDDFDRSINHVTRRNRNMIIGALRHCLSQVALEFLKPDLIVLDEFQRFSNILEESNKAGSVVGRLFDQPKVATLILSATPYKMLTLNHEAEDHYTDFMRTLRFLFKCDENNRSGHDTAAMKRLKTNLELFKSRLKAGEWFSKPDDELAALKSSIETDLRKVMCRTERNWYVEDHKKGVEELGVMTNSNPSPAELSYYIQLRHFLLREKLDDWNITDFWKSAPSPLSFMDAHYSLIKRLRAQKRQPLPKELLQSGNSLFAAGVEHLKVRTLIERVMGLSTNKLKFLWIKPLYTYHADDFYLAEDPTKFLVFSHWKFVPKAISVLLSHEAEKRLVKRRRGRETVPLQFRQEISFSAFDVCYPSPVLADCINPAQTALNHGRVLTASQLFQKAKKSVQQMLEANDISISRTQKVPLWRIIARLESRSKWANTIRNGIRNSDVRSHEARSEQYRYHRGQYLQWTNETTTELTISPAALKRLTLIALYSPAVALLRSMRSVLGGKEDWEKNNWLLVLNLGLNQLRNYFNKPIVQSVLHSYCSSERFYSMKVLDYCGRAHFQAMLDEYSYLLRTALPQKQEQLPAAFLLQVGRVLGLGTGSPSINELTSHGHIRPRPSPRPAHFAVAFGDDATSEANECGGRSRKTAVREAFNSPFWPFVLATTSVGQEGLDFHLYCRDIMHWNLPSNPVDLEQREGRINRFDALSIRRSIARDYPLASVTEVESQKPNVWTRLFALLESHSTSPQRFKHGLYPHWLYQSLDTGGQMIRRHLAFYAGSRDHLRYNDLKVALSLYRLVFGQPRQQDVIESLLKMFPEANPSEISNKLTNYIINLSPIEKGHATRVAMEEAQVLIDDPQKLAATLAAVHRLLESDSAIALKPVIVELHQILDFVAGKPKGDRSTACQRTQALECLLYLLNSFDDIYDCHQSLGYVDEIARVRKTHAALAAVLNPPQTAEFIVAPRHLPTVNVHRENNMNVSQSIQSQNETYE